MHRPFNIVGALLLLMLASSAATARKVEQIETPAGIRAWLVEERSIPIVSMKFTFEGGAMQDPPERGGLASLLASLLTEGAGDFNSDSYARRMAEEGVEIVFSASRDQIHGGLDALAGRFPASAELLRLALTAPRFDADAVERVRQQQVANIDLVANEPRAVSLDAWYGTTFPGHPYGRSLNGTANSVRAASPADIKALHGRLMARDRLRVVIVGDIDRVQAMAALDRIFGALPARATLTAVPKVEPRVGSAPVIVAKDLPLSTSAFGTIAPPANHADFPALQVLNHIIGSGDFDATLMEEIRVKRGLAYSVAVSLINDASASVMLGGMATKSENQTEALAVLKQVLQRMSADGPTGEQVDNAKLYLTGSYVLDFDTNTKLAGSLIRLWLGGRGPEFLDTRNDAIKRVSIDDVRRVARTMLAWDRFNLVIVGPGK
ncbi:MAG: M16 family metallopeptidase [Hyphomicrobiaceae bacterium]